MHSPFVELLGALADVFSQLSAGWYLFGAQAALLHGAARLTADVDVTVDLQGRDPDVLAKALSAAGFQMRVEDIGFTHRTRVLPVLHLATGIAADIVLAGPGLEELFLQRAQPHDIDGIRVPVACAEDMIVMKILAGRPKDVEDVVAIVAARKELKLDLVRSTLRMLEEALDRNDLLRELARAVARVQGAGEGTERPSPGRSGAKKRRQPRRR
ncbi:nucleotidyltransferase [Sorangium sp. So ce448]|uniref:nucleotidyltransferase n=1 Tax=Sorangium sp. So ce448 TaxID=3133314 RepID=UPI003F641F37